MSTRSVCRPPAHLYKSYNLAAVMEGEGCGIRNKVRSHTECRWGEAMDPSLWSRLPLEVKARIYLKLPTRLLGAQEWRWTGGVLRKLMASRKWSTRSPKDQSFFPIIVHDRFERWLCAYSRPGVPSSYNWSWLMLPSLAFLPRDVNDILASAGGLLFVEGGQQPRTHNNYDDPPYLCDWNFNYEAQSILCVCNPLTEEFNILPPLIKNLKNKVCRMDMSPGNDRSYLITVVGTQTSQGVSTQGRMHTEEIVVAIYDSQARRGEWVFWQGKGGLRTHTNSRQFSCLALANGVLYVAGEEKWGGHWHARVMAFDLHASSWDVRCFLPNYEPARIVECDGNAYAVSRDYNGGVNHNNTSGSGVALQRSRPTNPVRLVVFLITPTPGPACCRDVGFQFAEQACMPDWMFSLLFAGNATGEYECRAGLGSICFFSPGFNDVVGFLDVSKNKWQWTQYPYMERGVSKLVDCVWRPSLTIRP